MIIPLGDCLSLLHRCQSAALATHSLALPGYPFVTVLPFAIGPDHSPWLLMSGLAEHCRNVQADPRVSLLLQPPAGQVWEQARMTLSGDLHAETPDEALLARLLRVPSIVFAVNKLDAIEADTQAAFEAVRNALLGFAEQAGIAVQGVIPVSALRGDNVTTPSANWPWYAGPTLLQLLETLPVTDERHDGALLHPVQYVTREGEGTGHQPRTFWGRIAHGGVQAGDAGGVFQHAAPLLRLGLDDLADLALVDEGRRTRAGGGVGEQDLHVAGAHVAAVDAVDRAGFALDAAGDFKQLAVVDGGRCRAIGIVDRHHDFGVVARRTVAGTGEDHRIHVGGAQRLVRRLAHRPAQRFDEIGFAAAIRSDDAGQARLDHEIGGFNERLETVQAEARELHVHKSRLAGRESPCRDNTMDGNVGVWGE